MHKISRQVSPMVLFAIGLSIGVTHQLLAQAPSLAPYATASGDSVSIFLSVDARNQLDSAAPGFSIANGSIFRTRVAPSPQQRLSTSGSNFLLMDVNRDGASDLVLLGRVGPDLRVISLVSSRSGYRGELLVGGGAALTTGDPSAGVSAQIAQAGDDGFELIGERGKTRFSFDRSAGRWRGES